ncbi:MAG: malonic semialdehyde reductase [Alphaproteobacteria bacterium]|nr:malonic semialdehyde reductase [Alphaproteobacteria bacterium]
MTLDDAALDLLFLKARTHSHWQDREVPDSLLRQAWDLARMGPTSANCQPLRIVFARSSEAKERLRPALAPGNIDKTMAAPLTAICAYDLDFPDLLPRLFPQADAKSWYLGKPELTEATARLSATLQAAYFLMACRSLGLDLGPMGGFDAARLDAAFFPEGRLKSFLLMNIGYGQPDKLYPRNPRLEFDEACSMA